MNKHTISVETREDVTGKKVFDRDYGLVQPRVAKHLYEKVQQAFNVANLSSGFV